MKDWDTQYDTHALNCRQRNTHTRCGSRREIAIGASRSNTCRVGVYLCCTSMFYIPHFSINLYQLVYEHKLTASILKRRLWNLSNYTILFVVMYNNNLMLSGVRVIFSSDFALELDLSDDGSFVQMFVDRPFLIDGRWVAKFHPCILHIH